MVIESIINPRRAERKPYEMYFVGLFYSLIGIYMAWVMPFSSKAMTAVFLSTMACIPFIVNELMREEAEVKRKPLIGTHKDILGIFFFLFMGLLTGFIICSAALPDEMYTNLFSEQLEEILRIRGSFTGTSGAAVGGEAVLFFLNNNFRVMFSCLLFSFLYGAGAIFLLAWNASTLGVAIGTTIRDAAAQFGVFQAVNIGLGSYLLHGIPEILAYLFAAIAGGIISAAVVRHGKIDEVGKFYSVLKDSVGLILIASGLLILSAIVEMAVLAV
jgi:uncharacterized membrane protein SpoIIM required for sporulation